VPEPKAKGQGPLTGQRGRCPDLYHEPSAGERHCPRPEHVASDTDLEAFQYIFGRLTSVTCPSHAHWRSSPRSSWS